MQKARYYKADGAQSGEESLPEWLFDGVVNQPAMHQVVKAYQANQRQGTASAKSRGDVRGGSKKPWRQKGTGRARAGTIRAPHWEGGGVAFPPIPHSWRQKVPRKVRALARRSALNSRAGSERVVVIDRVQMDAPKTQSLKSLLAAMGVEGKALILTDGVNENVFLSSRNLQTVETRPFGQESVYDILWAHVIVIEKEALASAQPSKADTAATITRERGEPEVRGRVREEAEAQAARKKARMGHGKKSSTQPVSSSQAEQPAIEVAPAQAETAPSAASEPAAPEGGSDSGSDLESVKLPKVGDLVAFLAGYDTLADVETLQARDSRKTAQAHYEARIAELSGGGDEEE
jgi:large subunit ribosomal protein L4